LLGVNEKGAHSSDPLEAKELLAFQHSTRHPETKRGLALSGMPTDNDPIASPDERP
jgi:hypothetical protein